MQGPPRAPPLPLSAPGLPRSIPTHSHPLNTTLHPAPQLHLGVQQNGHLGCAKAGRNHLNIDLAKRVVQIFP